MIRPVLALAALALLATPATAHVVLAETVSAPNAYFPAVFRVGHGCAGKATTGLAITLPPGVTSAKPRPKPGWTAEVADGVVTWRGRLADAEFDEFSILVRLPADASGAIYFPTVQTCEGAEQRWVEIPEPGQPWTSRPNPAPVVYVAPSAAATAAPVPAPAHQH